MKIPLRGSTIGRLAALGSATSFAVSSTFAGLAYSDEAAPLAVVSARLLFGLLGTYGAVLCLRRPWSVPRHEWVGTAVVAVAWLVLSAGYMASFYYIPLSLAVLIFFTFPVQIALVGPLMARRRPEAVTLAATLIAFIGLALALGPDLGGLDWRGCLLALAAAVGAMLTFLLSRRLVCNQDMFTFSFNLHLLCAIALIAWAAGAGGIALPSTLSALAALAGLGVFYIAAVLLQFTAIRYAGPARAAIMFNAEPVVTVLAAGLLLGEGLGAAQAVGAALVVAGVLLSTRAREST